MDCNSATKSSISTEHILTSPEQFRAAAYWDNCSNKYYVGADIDFKDEIYFPIKASELEGNNHTLKNIKINLALCDSVGILSAGSANNLTAENINVTAHSKVGGIAGCCSGDIIRNCKVCGTSSVNGSGDYVGGLFGYYYTNEHEDKSDETYSNVSCCSIEGSTTISGKNNIGGLYGYFYFWHIYTENDSSIDNCRISGIISISGEENIGCIAGYFLVSSRGNDLIMNCKVEGDVNISNSTKYAGGLVGYYCGEYISDCSVKASISGTSSVGGLVGYASCIDCSKSSAIQSAGIRKSFFEGTVETSASYAGGLVGYLYGGTINQCYTIGNISADNYAGGLVGIIDKYRYNDYCFNSYSISNIKSQGSNCGGIAGDMFYIGNCYHYGTVSSGEGISPTLSSNYKGCNLTSSATIGGVTSENCNCNTEKTFLSMLNVINGDEAYSTQVWGNIDAKCPLLQWQSDNFDGDITAPGFGDEDW